MKQNCSFTALLWLFVLQYVVTQSTASAVTLPSPTNITARMTNMFHPVLQWNNADANCSLEYKVIITSHSPDPKRKLVKIRKESSVTFEVKIDGERLDLNNYFSLAIQAFCNNMTSEWVNKSHMQFIPGNKRTPVKNVSCVWHYQDYINCTWELRAEAAHNSIQYKLLYWDEKKKPEIFPESAPFQELLRSGTECQNYYPTDGLHLGCTFTYTTNVNEHLMFAVTDSSYIVKPLLYHTSVNDIAKLRSPVITNVSEVEKDTLYIKWNVTSNQLSQNIILSEVVVITDESEDTFTAPGKTEMTKKISNTDNTLRIKVRVKLSRYYSDSIYWSDWSKEWIIQDKVKDKTSLLLPTVIPAAVVVTLVILLICLKRLKILIWPSIPHPGKMFQNDLQHWIKSERPANVCHKPEEEHISPLALLKP